MQLIWSIILLCSFTGAFSRVIVVGKDRSVKTLSMAVSIARGGDTITISSGVYREGNIVISKSLVILGEGLPVFDGENKFEILTISGRAITVRGIHFKNAGRSSLNDFAAIKVVDATAVLIEQNTITNANFAIHLSNAHHCIIRNNTVSGSPTTEQNTGNGIHLWKCSYAVIDKNHVQGHRDGIYFEFVTESIIQRNMSEKNIRYGLHFMFSHNDTYFKNIFRNNGAGVAVMYSKKVLMDDNTFQKNWGANAYGILLKDISDSHIINSRFIQNTVAIHMEGSSRIKVERNSFSGNGWALKVQASCDENIFRSNNFHGNSFDVATNGTMMLNEFSGNYWDRYDGYDMDKNGIGDIPYHPVSMYSMIVEQNPHSLMLLRSFLVSLLDRAEKAIPSLTPENLVDERPMIKPNRL